LKQQAERERKRGAGEISRPTQQKKQTTHIFESTDQDK